MPVGFVGRTLSVVTLLVLSAALCGADVTFSQSDWTDLSADTEVALGPSANNAWTVEPTGGNPDSWVEFSESVSAGPVNIWTGLLTNAWVYDPSSQGTIYSIGFSADVNGISGPSPTGVQLLLLQGGNYYYGVAALVAAGSWQNSSTPSLLPSSLFWQINPVDGTANFSSHPDFTSAGTPITFGYALGVNTSVGATQGYDNIFIDVNNTVPEPGMLLPLGIGAGLFAIRRKARPRSRWMSVPPPANP